MTSVAQFDRILKFAYTPGAARIGEISSGHFEERHPVHDSEMNH